MAEFIADDRLNSEIIKLIEDAQEMIILISPFVKLHDRIKSSLKSSLENKPEIALYVVFGKNESDKEKSLTKSDLDFFKSLPNVAILYNSRLHAKYYASEKSAILSSMNLYDFSQNNNIEFGVLMKSSKIHDLTVGLFTGDSLDASAFSYFMKVIEQSDVIFDKAPQFKTGFLGFTSKYEDSKVEIDETENYFKGAALINKRKINKRFSEENSVSVQQGYCIRTGSLIPFNIKQPFSSEAYKSWSRFSNGEYPEKYCHFSGELSNGETSYSKPIMKKNWSKAKAVHSF